MLESKKPAGTLNYVPTAATHVFKIELEETEHDVDTLRHLVEEATYIFTDLSQAFDNISKSNIGEAVVDEFPT